MDQLGLCLRQWLHPVRRQHNIHGKLFKLYGLNSLLCLSWLNDVLCNNTSWPALCRNKFVSRSISMLKQTLGKQCEFIYTMMLYLILLACYKATVKRLERRQLRVPWSVLIEALCGLESLNLCAGHIWVCEIWRQCHQSMPWGPQVHQCRWVFVVFQFIFIFKPPSHAAWFSCTFIAHMLP